MSIEDKLGQVTVPEVSYSQEHPSHVRMQILDRLVTFIAVVFPLTGIPQLANIWVDKNVEGVSILTWSLFLVLTIPLLVYSLLKREKKLTIMWGMWCVVYSFVILGLMLYA